MSKSLFDARRDGREGMVTVVDYEGRIVGSMGVETWAKVLAEGDSGSLCECGHFKSAHPAADPVGRCSECDECRGYITPAERREQAKPSLFPFLHRAVLRGPSRHVGLAPDTAGGKRADRLREALRARELVGALLTHAEHNSDLCHSHEFHARECRP